MNGDRLNPLNETHRVILDQVLASNEQLARLIQDCTECRLDTAQALADVKEVRELAQSLKAKFFPHSP